MFKWNVTNISQTKKYTETKKNIFKRNTYKQYVQPQYQYGVLIYATANKGVLERLQLQQNFLVRIAFGFPKHKEVRRYDLLKFFIKSNQKGASINSFITDKEIDKSFDTERRIKTIPLIEKLIRKKRKLISVRFWILYNSLSTLDFDII